MATTIDQMKHRIDALTAERDALAAQLREGCTCGSGAHPRECKRHPGRFEAHCRELDAESRLGDMAAEIEDAARTARRDAINEVLRASWSPDPAWRDAIYAEVGALARMVGGSNV